MRSALIAVALLLLAGCSFVYARLSYSFSPLPENEQIRYEAGAEDLAKRAAALVERSMAEVEKRQFASFKDRKAIRLYVFSDRNRYARFAHASVLTRASSSTDEVYLSERLRERIDSLPSILVHELSHVHLRQYAGTLRYVSDIPGWFLEGLAVSVSGGAGAENVTAPQAKAAIVNGRSFQPDESGRIVGHKSAADYGLEPHMYYRQAALFVDYLRETDPSAFEATLLEIMHGGTFREAWPRHYGHTISELWRTFQRPSPASASR
jgi:hypothetical protein